MSEEYDPEPTRARVLIEMNGELYEVATAEGNSELRFIDNLVSALHYVADDIDYAKGIDADKRVDS